MLPNSELPNLIAQSQQVFNDVCTKRLGAMKHSPDIETDFTGSFVKNGVSQIEAAFNRSLNPYGVDVEVSSVYIHQSPMVSLLGHPPRTMRTKKCELGDVLFVQSHRRNPWKTYWRAALWQLKADNGKSQKTEDPQFWLYESWPLYEVYKGGLASGIRDFYQDSRSGYYGLVSKSSWLICPPSTYVGPNAPGAVEAGRFIAEMMYAVDPAQSGRISARGRRVFTRPKASPPLNWSHTIWEILNITGIKDFSARRLFSAPQGRLSMMRNSDQIELQRGVRPPRHTSLGSEELDKGLLVVLLSVDATDYAPRMD